MQKGQVQVIDAASLRLQKDYSVGHMEGATLGINGKLYYSDIHDVVSVLDVSTGKQTVLARVVPRLLRSHFARPSQLAFSPDNRFLVLAHHDLRGEGNVAEVGTFILSVMDVETGSVISRIPDEEEQVWNSDAAACTIPQMLFSPDGAKLYELCLWGGSYPLKPVPLLMRVELKKRTFSETLKLPKSNVAALTPDGRVLYVLSENGDLLDVDSSTLKVINTRSLQEMGGPTSTRFGAKMVVTPDGQRLYFTDGLNATTVYAFKSQTGDMNPLALKDPIEDIAISPNGNRLYLLVRNGLISVDTKDCRELSKVKVEGISPRECILSVLPAVAP